MIFGSTVFKREFFKKFFWSVIIQGKVMLSFVLVICYFNYGTLDPLKPFCCHQVQGRYEKAG